MVATCSRGVALARVLLRAVRTAEGCLVLPTQATGWYTVVSAEGKQFYVHRLVFEEVHGSTELFVCHRCDNPPCFESSHLFEGTQKDNLVDMVSKGRARKSGTHCGKGHEFTIENTGYQKSPGGLSPFCRKCSAEKTRRWRENNLEKSRASHREQQRLYREADPERHRRISRESYHRVKERKEAV